MVLSSEAIAQPISYTNALIGWTVGIPPDFSVSFKDEPVTRAENQRSSDMLEETIGTALDYSGLNYMIAFTKGPHNSFISTINSSLPFKDKNEWLEYVREGASILLKTFEDQGINYQKYQASLVFNNIEFEVLKTGLHNKSGELYLVQEHFSTWIDGHDVAITMSYNNTNDRNALYKAFQESVFKKTQ